MHGLVFEIFEEWAIQIHGLEAWHRIKRKAGCDVKDKSFVTRTFYNYEIWVKLINAAAEEIDSSFDDILEAYGHFNIKYHFSHGHDALLRCQGSTLRQWLSNLNAMHDHVQKSFPGENFCPPVFWCEDCDTVEGSILLHYFSQRGNLLVPWVVGIVEELAFSHFEVEVKMHRLAKQDEEGSKFTTWRITAADESQQWKLSPKASGQTCDGAEEEAVNFDGVRWPSKCPFTGKKLKKTIGEDEKLCPHAKRLITAKSKQTTTVSVATASTASTDDDNEQGGLSLNKMKEVFPFHVLVNNEFEIVQVGAKLPKLLERTSSEFAGVHIKDVLKITRPVLGTDWDWRSLNKLSDQNFFLAPTLEKGYKAAKRVSIATGNQKFSMAEESVIKFKASIVNLSPDRVMFTLSPEARNVDDLNNMGLTLSDLPLQSCQRDAVFLGEYITQEADKAHNLDKLSRKLGAEQDLSNTLLYNILPEQVADDLRKGKTIEPTFHENVTLFFSDIVGFTKLCGQVEPWNVIDMMNQLYSVMDFLADRFNLYKVETVGDSYMCCSGLPEPDEYHAENVANFALAVLECVKHVKSPVTGMPIDLRIGIHTGSCTSGVVGTLTPHYCPFGDMVNFTSRHESTGIPGKIHCSSVLHGRLTHFAQSDNQAYNLKARGLVDMKGKGEHYTYWLEGGTQHNTDACPSALAALSNEVAAMISSRKWKMRKYFKHGGLFRGQDASSVGEATTSSNEESSGNHSLSDSSGNQIAGDAESVHSDDSDLMDDIEEDDLGSIIRFTENQLISFENEWEVLQWDDIVSQQIDLPSKTFEALFSILKACVGKGGARLKVIDEQLRSYVQSTAAMYSSENPYHSFNLASEVVLRANFLWEKWADLADPWDHFVLLFAALIHGAEHTGVDNVQLEAENDLLSQIYSGKQSYQQRSSFDSAFEMLEEDFEELYEEITYGCPNFRSVVKKLVVQFTDLESEEKIRDMLSAFEEITQAPTTSERVMKEQREARVGLVLSMATVGHYSQSYDKFLRWNQLDFQEHLKARCTGRAEDRRDSWYYEQTMLFSDAIVPLVEHVEKILPRAILLGDSVRRNIDLWRENGRERIAATLLPSATVEDYRGEKLSMGKIGGLISTNVDLLEGLLKDVAASHSNDGDLAGATSKRESNPVDDIQLVIEMKEKNSGAFQPTADLSTVVKAELRDFVITIAAGYQNNEFHNFQHTSHVAHLSNLLVKGISGIDGHKDGTGIACDPLAHFAIVLSALVHDVGHTGVPNGQLAKEQPDLALKYESKSIAEQNSIDVTWKVLNADCFQNLQRCLFADSKERERLRQLLVNCVMATDIFDKDLCALRQSRWDKVYSDNDILNSSEEKAHVKATIVIEHIMQASDVAHTMQGWDIYRQWNESLFLEMHQAFLDGRADKDPSEGWYGGELWFFDNWVVPLAENLKACGVLDIVSDQLVAQAQSNRRQWEIEGREISAAMLETAKVKANQQAMSARSASSARSSESEVMLTSKIVSEVESLSRVVRRYERKMEAACGSLIAVAYKGKPSAKELRKKKWSDIHQHFKEQDWYKIFSDDEFSEDGSELFDNPGLNSYIRGGHRSRGMARGGGDDFSSIGSSVSGLRSQLAIAERAIASSMVAYG